MRVAGAVRVPGDKSISHRALIVGALAHGRSMVRDILRSDDVEHTAGVLRALGVKIPPLAREVVVSGRGPDALTKPLTPLDCGNSGTTARLVAGVCASRPFASRLVGDASLSRRPMRRIADPLRAMGARVELERGDGLPMDVEGGALHAINWATETASAQVKSAILLAGTAARVPVVVKEPTRSRDHTERMLRAAGAEVDVIASVVRLEPPERLHAVALTVPADPSSAAFLCALAALADSGGLSLPQVCLNPTRTGFFRALQRMGARLEMHGGGEQAGEEVGEIFCWSSALHAIRVDAADIPAMIDELPVLACVAARAEGTTTIRGAGELRVKESDRIATVAANLRAIGVEVAEYSDGMDVTGMKKPLEGRVVTRGDHRIAMAFGVLGRLDGNRIEIDDPACVSVSYPDFWDDIRRATGGQ